MSKKGLNIYHRKSDNRWEGRYKIGFKEDGTVKYRSIYGKSYSEVKEQILKLRCTKLPSNNCSMTIEHLFMEWLDTIMLKTKESTYSNYLFKVQKHLIPAFGNMKFDALSPKAVYDFIQQKHCAGLSMKYISDMVILLKGMAKYTAKTYRCINRIADLELPKKERSELMLYTQKEQDILQSELQKEMNLTKLGILVCLFTGIRVGELCALKWSDINIKGKYLSINKTIQRIYSPNEENTTKLVISVPKSNTSIRMIPLPDFLITFLEQFQSSENVYLLSGTMVAVEPRTMQYRFKALLKKANLPIINFHSLRHMFATNCIALGFDMKTLSEILGHASVEITLNRYVHSSMERKIFYMQQLKLETK